MRRKYSQSYEAWLWAPCPLLLLPTAWHFLRAGRQIDFYQVKSFMQRKSPHKRVFCFPSFLCLNVNKSMDSGAAEDCQDGPVSWGLSNHWFQFPLSPQGSKSRAFRHLSSQWGEFCFFVCLFHKDCSGNSEDFKVVWFWQVTWRKLMSLDSYTTSFFICRVLLL